MFRNYSGSVEVQLIIHLNEIARNQLNLLFNISKTFPVDPIMIFILYEAETHKNILYNNSRYTSVEQWQTWKTDSMVDVLK